MLDFGVIPMSPDTDIYLCKVNGLDNTYKDTIDFSNLTEQLSFFTSKSAVQILDAAPVRFEQRIRIPRPADSIITCNYLIFRNNNFQGHYFFAFIDKVHFVNTNMCEIEYEIDPVQTWMFDMNVLHCVVDREHTQTDEIGDHLLPEPIDAGDIVQWKQEKLGNFATYDIVVGSSYNAETQQEVNPSYVNGVVSGVSYNVFSSLPGGLNDFENYIDQLTAANQLESIVSIALVPVGSDMFDTGSTVPFLNQDVQAPNKGDAIGSYIPRNNKLYTFPYNYIRMCTESQEQILRYEWFNRLTSGMIRFTIRCFMSPDPECFIAPYQYNGTTFVDGDPLMGVNMDFMVRMNDFPQVAIAIDSYKAWHAMNAGSAVINSIKPVASTISGAVKLMNPVSAGEGASDIISAGIGIANTVNDAVINSTKSYGMVGKQGSGMLAGMKAQAFFLRRMCSNDQQMRVIDDYFDKYGYHVGELKIPNTKTRPFWNYIQCTSAEITGNIPTSHLDKLRKIYQSGITFWHGDYVGDYGRDNRV